VREIRGRHALVTGGSRGLGPRIAQALAEQGANLTLTARTADALRDVAQSLDRFSVRVHAIPADVCDDEGRRALVEGAEAELGPVDILVNNAGLECIAPFTRLPPRRIGDIIETNLVAPLMLSRLILPEMLERGRGHVVMMSSFGGKKGLPYSASYAATKSALIEWTNAIRGELRGSGVGVSVICPGFVSEVGMFAVRAERAPWILGTSSPEAVARATLRAIRDDVREIVVNPGPVTLMMVAEALSPRLTSWVLEKTGALDYYRRRAELDLKELEQAESSEPPAL